MMFAVDSLSRTLHIQQISSDDLILIISSNKLIKSAAQVSLFLFFKKMYKITKISFFCSKQENARIRKLLQTRKWNL